LRSFFLLFGRLLFWNFFWETSRQTSFFGGENSFWQTSFLARTNSEQESIGSWVGSVLPGSTFLLLSRLRIGCWCFGRYWLPLSLLGRSIRLRFIACRFKVAEPAFAAGFESSDQEVLVLRAVLAAAFVLLVDQTAFLNTCRFKVAEPAFAAGFESSGSGGVGASGGTGFAAFVFLVRSIRLRFP
jgi:hypothetical protein